MSRGSGSWLLLALALAAFAGPLMVGLAEPELQSDEAIYSYAVERVLDTGDWLTPRSIPSDAPFLEKPPLKFWLVAGAMRAGVLPRNEAGLRAIDGLFGAISFIYIYVFGRKLAGDLCGLVAVMTLFGLDPLLFDHGLRSNNMEAAVFLAYSGGMYHFARWVEAADPRDRRRHAYGVALFFTLGFLTKFVAALFLPLAGVVALLWRPNAVTDLRARWKDWIGPVALVLVVSAPWFLYEGWRFGSDFWRIIFGVHVFERFTGTLDPTHLHVWHHYFSASWRELGHAGAQLLTVVGGARLVFLAVRGDSWLARLALVWGLLPVVLISFGTSKLLHYAYPFFPPMALAVGVAAAWWIDILRQRADRVPTPNRYARHVLVVAVALLLMSAAWIGFVGPVRLEWSGTPIFRSTAPLRPVIFAAALVVLAGGARTYAMLAGAALLALVLPLRAYEGNLHELGRVEHPLRATRDCLADVRVRNPAVGAGVLAASGDILHHSYYFYLGRTGPWVIAPRFDVDEALARLTIPGEQTPVIVKHPDAETLRLRLPAAIGAVAYDTNVTILLPGPFARCEAEILATGARPMWPAPGTIR